MTKATLADALQYVLRESGVDAQPAHDPDAKRAPVG